MVREMKIELTLHRDMQLIIRDAQNSTIKQIRDIRELAKKQIDLLIVSPNVSGTLTPVVEEVYNSGIPVIIIDRQIDSEAYTAYIGADNYLIGREAAKYAGNKLHGSGKVLEITGLMASSPAKKRHRGFIDGLKDFPGVVITRQVSGKWNKYEGKSAMRSVLHDSTEFDLVFAHNDFMAIGAYEAAAAFNRQDDYFFLGTDGLPTEEGGIQYIIDGKLDATLLYPTGGSEAIQLASKILHDKPFNKNNSLETVLIDSSNAHIMQSQLAEIIDLQNKIKNSRNILHQQIEKNQSQRLLLIASVVSLLLLILVVALILRANQQKKRANQKLTRQKAEIEQQKQAIQEQNEQLKQIKNKLEETTQAKLRFFTNISHELRTPLTLIIGPLENLLKSHDTTDPQKKHYRQMYRNANRLLRLINQLMDFRKIEQKKMRLATAWDDMIDFLREIEENFEPLAEKQQIDFRFRTTLKSLYLRFDRDKVDKIIFNLLSNAFKFTGKGGKIELQAIKTQYAFIHGKRQAVKISVEDNGRGMSQEHVKRIFERFFQIQQTNQPMFPSSGIGLSLTQNLVNIHRGHIEVTSKKGAGSRFDVFLPLDDAYLRDDEKLETIDNADRKHLEEIHRMHGLPAEACADTDVPSLVREEATNKPDTDQNPVVLIVENNADVRSYIRESLHQNYFIIEAENGREGLQKAWGENPDLVIADVMMPEMDGFQMLQKIKSDIRTCHIPVIILTAKATIEHKLKGLEEGADSYIPKPFYTRHLQIRVKKLIESRQHIRKHYRDTLSFKEPQNTVNRLDRQFLQNATRLVEENLQNEQFTVETFGRELGLSRVHLYRKIKQLTGMSVSEFIRSVRLHLAVNLLRKGTHTIAEAAYEVGFSTPSYFSRSFKKQYQMSPKEFLEQNG